MHGCQLERRALLAGLTCRADKRSRAAAASRSDQAPPLARDCAPGEPCTFDAYDADRTIDIDDRGVYASRSGRPRHVELEEAVDAANPLAVADEPCCQHRKRKICETQRLPRDVERGAKGDAAVDEHGEGREDAAAATSVDDIGISARSLGRTMGSSLSQPNGLPAVSGDGELPPPLRRRIRGKQRPPRSAAADNDHSGEPRVGASATDGSGLDAADHGAAALPSPPPATASPRPLRRAARWPGHAGGRPPDLGAATHGPTRSGGC